MLKKVGLLLAAVLCIPTLSQFAAAEAQIERLLVTANRFQSKLQNIPNNISWLDSETLARIDHQHISQAMQRIAGVWVSRGNGQEHLTAIRSPVLTGAGGCGAFFIAQDGISSRAPYFCNANQLFDLNTEQAQQIEVLRGPNSTLYGSNAVHGVINVLSADIEQLLGAQVFAESGPNDYYRLGFSGAQKTNASKTTEGQTHNHGWGLQANVTHDGGYKDNSGFDQQKVNLIQQTQWQGWAVKNVLAASNLNQETSGFIQGFEAYRDESRKRENPNPEAYRDSQSVRAYSIWQKSTSQNSDWRITPYFRWSSMEFLQHFLPWQATENNAQRSLGIQIQNRRSFAWGSILQGLDMDFSRGYLREVQADPFSPTIPAGSHYDYVVDTRVISPFINAQIALAERWQLDVGVRYDASHFDYTNQLSDGSACDLNVQGCRFFRPEDQTRDFREWSFAAGLSKQINDQHQFYARLSRGYRAPQATELFRLQAGQANADLDAEQLTSTELGLRGNWQALQYSVSAFHMQKDNFIFQDSDRQNISDGETKHRGIELAFSMPIVPSLMLSGNATYAKHTYDNAIRISRENIQGNEIDTAPNTLAGLQLLWQVNERLSTELEWAHMGSYYLNPENTAKYAGHDLLHLRSQYQLNQQLQISLNLLNLTDQDYAERADFGFGNYRYFVGEPRSVFLQVEYRH